MRRLDTMPLLKVYAPAIMLVFVAGTLCAQAQVQPGTKLPPLTVRTLSGQTLNLPSFYRQNQGVVVSFWAKFLPLTTAELPALQKLHAKYGAPGRLQMLGFAMDLETRSDLEQYLKRLKPRPTFEVCGSKVSKHAATKYNVHRFPTVYVVNSAGVVSFVETGFGAGSPKHIEAAIKRVLAGTGRGK